MPSKTMRGAITLVDCGPLTRIQAHLRDLIEICLTSGRARSGFWTLKKFQYVSDEKCDDKFFMHCTVQAREHAQDEPTILGVTFIVSKLSEE